MLITRWITFTIRMVATWDSNYVQICTPIFISRMRRPILIPSMSPFEEPKPYHDNSSEFDKHMSKQTVPRLPQGGPLYDVCQTETYNEMEAIRKCRMAGSEWAARMNFDDQTGPGASNWTPGSFSHDD